MLIKDLSKDLDAAAMTEVTGGEGNQGNVLGQGNGQVMDILHGNGNGSIFNGPSLIFGDVVATQDAQNHADLYNYKGITIPYGW
jgi:hypothetical protein